MSLVSALSSVVTALADEPGDLAIPADDVDLVLEQVALLSESQLASCPPDSRRVATGAFHRRLLRRCWNVKYKQNKTKQNKTFLGTEIGTELGNWDVG